jgi:drug/metabolite transporter (DMT)-like permease
VYGCSGSRLGGGKIARTGATEGLAGTARFKSSTLAWAALALNGLIFGYNWVVMKSALNYADPATFAALRVFLAAVLMFLLLVVLRRPLRLVNWRLTLLVGLFGTAGMTGLTFWALQSGGAGKTSVLVYTMPIWLLLTSWAVLGEKVRGLQWPLVGLTLIGLVFVISPWEAQGSLVSNLLGVGAGLCSAASALVVKLLTRDRRVDLLALNAWQMLIGSVPLVIIALATAESGPRLTGWFWATLFYNAVLVATVAMFLWFYALRHLPAGTAGLGRLIAPVIGVVTSWLQLGERLDGYEIVGVVLIMVGLTALAVHQSTGERRAPRAESGPAGMSPAGAPEQSPVEAGLPPGE